MCVSLRQQVHQPGTSYRQAVGFQSGHAASGGRSGVQHVLPRHFELSALGRHVAIPHGHEDGFLIAPVQPLIGLHGRLGPRRVRVQVVLEEVRLGRKATKKRAELICFCTMQVRSISNTVSVYLFLIVAKKAIN